MSGFVVDSSVALTWLFLEEATPATQMLFDRLARETAVVPGWWFIELTNASVMGERKRRVSAAQIAEFIRLLDCLELDVDHEASARAFSHLLPLCRAYSLTSYDAMYLDLAIRRGLPLATLDKALRTAARAAGVELLC